MLSASEIYEKMLSVYGKPRWWSDDPFTVMFQSVLVQNTAWNNVIKTCEKIGEKLTPQYIDELSCDELEQIITPCGFYKAKSKTIKSLVEWFKKYDFSAENAVQNTLYELCGELLKIRGIGAETADVILVYALHQPSFIIDAYTRRFLQRLGYSFADDTEIKNFFEAGLPKNAEIYGYFHWLILDHCISVCKKNPKCESCKLKAYCEYFGGK